jgi:uncharacterized protein
MKNKKNCCRSNNKDKECMRKSDNKIFKLPRRFSKKKCKNPKGFTMRSSCAPYKDCYKRTKRTKRINKKKTSYKGGLTYKKNILGKKIKVCSTNPMTGYYRNGYCMTGEDDLGTHTVCAKMNKKFLNYTKKKGNDLSSVVKPGQNWCLCEYRWNEAYKDGKAPPVIKSASNMRTKKNIVKNIMKGGNKDFLYNPNNPKKSFDVYIDKNPKDTIPIKYKNLKDVKETIVKLEKLYKSNKYSHKRIWQVGMIMMVRLRVIKDKKSKQFALAKRYFEFLGKRSKLKDDKQRKNLTFS